MPIKELIHGRTVAVVAGTAVLVTLGGVGGAVAHGQITGADIQNNSIGVSDIGPFAVKKSELGTGAVVGIKIKDGVIGEKELSLGVKTKLNPMIEHASIAAAVAPGEMGEVTAECPSLNKVAISGGFSVDGDVDQNQIHVVADHNSAFNRGWTVKAFNNGAVSADVRAWVICASGMRQDLSVQGRR